MSFPRFAPVITNYYSVASGPCFVFDPHILCDFKQRQVPFLRINRQYPLIYDWLEE